MAFALTFHLLLVGLVDLAIFARYRRVLQQRFEGDTSWLYAPPRPWSKAFDSKGITKQALNQPLRLLHTETERTYLEEQIAEAKLTIHIGLRALASYMALLVFFNSIS